MRERESILKEFSYVQKLEKHGNYSKLQLMSYDIG